MIFGRQAFPFGNVTFQGRTVELQVGNPIILKSYLVGGFNPL